MNPVYPFNNFDLVYEEQPIVIHDEQGVQLTCIVFNKLIPSIRFSFSVNLNTLSVTNTDRSNFTMYVLQNISSWLLYGEAVVQLNRPEIPITGAFDKERGEWYILDNEGNRFYESMVLHPVE